MKEKRSELRRESDEEDVQDLKGFEQELLGHEFGACELEEDEQLAAESRRRLPDLRETIEKSWEYLRDRDYNKLAELIKKIVEIIETISRFRDG